ncbi:hypothetical protein BASA81_000797 [Batrachochytrium salamandrivorans]|nr:hypothetical protein BASA81_000797 [Batrachochytrium salamandrivorans]
MKRMKMTAPSPTAGEDAGGDSRRPTVCMDGVLGSRKIVFQPRPRANSDPAIASALPLSGQRRLSQSAV